MLKAEAAYSAVPPAAPGPVETEVSSGDDEAAAAAAGTTTTQPGPDVVATSSSPSFVPEESEADRRRRRFEKVARFRRTFSFSSLLDPTQNWVLMEKGSFLGFFDWVPEKLRVGPWSFAAISTIFGMYYLTALATAYYHGGAFDLYDDRTTTTSIRNDENGVDVRRTSMAPFSLMWSYHVAGFAWMLYICYRAYTGPVGPGAWLTYTMQSWTLLMFRHLLVALSPFWATARVLADRIRFASLCSATITFCVWNFFLFPGVYWFVLRTDQERQQFWNFCTSFRLRNVHGLNIFLAVWNNAWADPPPSITADNNQQQPLEWFPDFFLAALSMMMYMTMYYFVYDRLGFHLYPLFSPRASTWQVLAVTTAFPLTYAGVFVFWRNYLREMATSY